MWPFKKNKFDSDAYISCLKETIELIDSSEDSIWSGVSGDEICMDLKIAIEEIEKGAKHNRAHLSMLFAPTGPIQEISIENGWAEKYLDLSAIIDELNNK